MFGPVPRTVAVSTAAALALSLLQAPPVAAGPDPADAADSGAAAESTPASTQQEPTQQEQDALALARESGERVEVAGLTDEKTQHFAHPDGSLTAEVSAVPARVRSDDGWVDVDTTLVPDDLDRLVETVDARGQSLVTDYDELGRETALRDGDGELRASWEYDSIALGQPTSSTRHHQGEEYTWEVLTYDALDRPINQSFDIPDSEGELAGEYLFGTDYNPDGSVSATTAPAAGALPTEVVVNTYDELGNPVAMSGNDHIVSESVYSKIGNLVQREFHQGGTGTNRTWQSFDFDEKTNFLAMDSVVPQAGDGSVQTQTYGYDDRGNLLSINDEPTDDARASDVQCFDYDHLRRLSQVWTPDATGEEACAPEPEVDELGGAAPYWHEFSYDETGNRVEEVQHGPGGGTSREYSAPEEGAGPAHAISEVEESGSAGNSVHSYDYDESGNMVARSNGEHDQSLEWAPKASWSGSPR